MTLAQPFLNALFPVYSADVIDSLQKPAQGPETETRVDRKAVIILIPVRLGGEKTNPEYYDFVKVQFN